MTRAARWIELGVVFGVLPVMLALYARALALPVLFVAAWVCLAVLWRDPTFQRDELWRREHLWTRRPARTGARRTTTDAAWADTFLELVRAARLARSGRRTLVARPRPAF